MTSKKLLILVPIVIFISLAFYLSSHPEIKNISTEELHDKLENASKQTYFIDVRELDEFEAGHIKGMENIPLSMLKAKKLGLDKNSEIILFCRSGNRSMQAAKTLQEQGYKNIINVRGGIQSWQGDIVTE